MPESQSILAEALNLPLKIHEIQKIQKDESVRLEITLTKEQYQQLLQCRDKASHLLRQNQKDSSWASVIEVLATQFAAKTTTKPFAEVKPLNTTDLVLDCDIKAKTKPPKTLTPKLRREVLLRDLCCQFKDPQTGKQCQSTFALQVDHRQARWAEGSNDKLNLQALCATHNSYKYRKESSIKRV